MHFSPFLWYTVQLAQWAVLSEHLALAHPMHAKKKKRKKLKDPSLLTGKLPKKNTTWEMKKLHVANTKQFIEH